MSLPNISVLLQGAFLGIILLLPASAVAQQLFLPVEASDGVLIPDATPYPFTASVRFHPALGFGREGAFRIGPSAAVAFANPGISVQGGGRAQVRLKNFALEGFSFAQIDLAAEALWGTKDRNPIGGALLLSLNRTVQFTLRGGYDLGQEAVYIGGAVGTDLSLWLGIHPKPPRFRPIPIPFAGCAFDIFAEAKVQLQAGLPIDPDAQQQTIERIERFLQREGTTFRSQPTLEQARQFLAANDLSELAGQMNTTLDFSRNTPACEAAGLLNIDTATLLQVFFEAWTDAVRVTQR